MSQPKQPNHGARFRFVRQRGDAASATYALRISVADAVWTTDVAMVDGNATLGALTPDGHTLADAPAQGWVLDHAQRLAKQLARGHAKDGLWQRRFERWKEAPSR